MALPIPTAVPEPGYYYHNKHDPAKGVNHYAYEVIGIGFKVEDGAEKSHSVQYLPLYEGEVYETTKKFCIRCSFERDLEEWMSTVTKGEQKIPRFIRITNTEIIAELTKIRDEMYPKN